MNLRENLRSLFLQLAQVYSFHFHSSNQLVYSGFPGPSFFVESIYRYVPIFASFLLPSPHFVRGPLFPASVRNLLLPTIV